MNVETALEKALGRLPTAEERKRLMLLREAFEIRDNDALWALVGVNEYYNELLRQYNALLRQYPDQCAQAARQAVRECWPPPTAGRRVSGSTEPLPSPAAGTPNRELYWVTMGCSGMAASLLSSGLALLVGPLLSGGHPCWVPRSTMGSISVSLLGAPLGWLVVVLLLVPSGYGWAWAWRRGRDAARSRGERALGWSALVGISGAVALWVMLLSQLAAARQ